MAADGSRELSRAECRALLERMGWGMLATVGERGPYAVPVGYALGREELFLASGEGRKLDNLAADPRVCLTVCDVAGFERWRCVLVEGEAAPLSGAAATALAVAAFMAQSAPRADASASDARRLLGASFFRLPLAGMTGRARGG